MSGRFSAILAAALLAAAGCGVNQDKETARYRSHVDLPPATRPAGAPLSLRDALRLTNQYNERLSIEGENYLQATLARKQALAAFLPVASLSGSYALGEASSSADSNHTTDAWLSGNINLFNGFRDIQRLRAADLTIEQRRLLLLDLQESLLADTLRTYFSALRDERVLEVLSNTAALQEARVRDITARQQAGTARPLDVAQSEAQASRTRVDLLNARRDLANDRTALAFLTHSAVEPAPLVDSDELPAPSGTLQQLQELAGRERQDLLAARAATEANRHNIEVAVGQYYPSLSLNLKAFLTRQSSPSDRDWESLLQANLPLFSAGQIEADVRQAWSQYRQSALFTSLLSRQINQDVELAWRNLQSSRQRLKELDVQVAAAQQALTQAEGSYNVGLATNLERLTAQDQLLSAQLQRTSENYNYRIYSGDLLRAIGGLRRQLEPPAPTVAAR